MIGLELIGDAEVVRKLEALPPRMREELKAGIGRLALKLQRSVERDKLSGQVLHVRTGRLRRSISETVVEEGDVIAGVVSSAVKYAAVHEFGFHGVVTVREHLRRSRAQFSQARFTKTGRETAASKKRFSGKGEIMVRTHTRHVDLPERSFLRSALRDMERAGVIREELDAAIVRSVR